MTVFVLFLHQPEYESIPLGVYSSVETFHQATEQWQAHFATHRPVASGLYNLSASILTLDAITIPTPVGEEPVP